MVAQSSSAKAKWALMVHGGVDPRAEAQYSPEEHQSRHQAIKSALEQGAEILSKGGRSVDAVQSSIRVLEDAPEFNAARGAALTSEGRAELDAALMDGRGARVGAVAALRTVKNPIDLARAVMDRSSHVFLVGEGAEKFARMQQVVLVDPGYFVTERQSAHLQRTIARENEQISKGAGMSGTVGAVALDLHGDLAAGTSTGGMTNKKFGRVGDSPVIGACVFAQNGVCAVSTTGWGEFFIRKAVAHDICARVKYNHESLETAAKDLIQQVHEMGGYGGLIGIDASGQMANPYSTVKMAHGYVGSDSSLTVILAD